jgi:hypothetical protein
MSITISLGIELCSEWTDVSEEHITSIFRIEQQPIKKRSYSTWLGRFPPSHLQQDSNVLACGQSDRLQNIRYL